MIDRETMGTVLTKLTKMDRESFDTQQLRVNGAQTLATQFVQIVTVGEDICIGRFVYATKFSPLEVSPVPEPNLCYVYVCPDIEVKPFAICMGDLIGVQDNIPVIYTCQVCNPPSVSSSSGSSSGSSGSGRDPMLVNTYVADVRCEAGKSNVYVSDLYNDFTISPIRFSHQAGCCECPPIACPECICSAGDTVLLGTTRINTPIPLADGIGPGLYLYAASVSLIFCPPRGGCDYQLKLTNFTSTGFTAPCEDTNPDNPGFVSTTTFAIYNNSPCTSGGGGTAVVDTSTTSLCSGTLITPDATITLPGEVCVCCQHLVYILFNWTASSNTLSLELDFDLVITEGTCA